MKRFLWLILFLLCSGSILADTFRFFDRITVDNGLSSNHVFAVWQDKKGYIWLGTANGLQRFDGRYFVDVTITKPRALPAQPVRQIIEDHEGRMWLKYGDQFGIFNPLDRSFQAVPLEKKADRFRGEKLWIDSQGEIYLLLTKHKLLYFDKGKKTFSQSNSPIQLPENFIPSDLFEDPQTGFIWVSGNSGMLVYDRRTQTTYHSDFNPLNLPHLSQSFSGVTHYLIDNARNHRMVYWDPDQKFSSYSEAEKRFTEEASSLLNNSREYREIQGFLQTRAGELWYYGANSLYVFNPVTKVFEDQKHKLKYSQINQIYEDREGTLWLASDEGIYRSTDNAPWIVSRAFTGKNHVLLDIKEIQTGASTQYWLTSWGQGILRLDTAFNALPTSNLYRGYQDEVETLQTWVLLQERHSGLVWVGAQKGGLHIIDPATLKATVHYFPVFRQSTIRSISQDQQGNVWFTTQRGDLIKYEGGKPIINASFKVVKSFNGYAFTHLVDHRNRVWVGTSDKGVFCMDAESGEVIKQLTDSILSSNRQEKMVQLNDSIYFFGHDLLNAYNDRSGENRILSYSDGMISNGILNMQADADGYLWIYTPRGLCRYNYLKNTFTQYPPREGFKLLEVDGNGGTTTSKGNIIFIGYESLTAFDPNHFNNSIKPDRPVLTGMSLFNHYFFADSLNTDEKRTFPHDQNALTFYFSTLNYAHQEKLKYYHKLSHVDHDWRLSASNMAVYSLLPPGDYVFEFRSENEEGLSSPIGSFAFTITPPLYATWWFRMLLGVLVVGTLALIYRLHINRILAVVKLRNRVARDLHDDMGSTLSTINILSTMAKTKLVTDPVKSSEYISKISDNSHRMMEAMDDIVWSIKPQNDNMEKIIARMREFSTSVLEAKNIDFRFEVDEAIYRIKLPMEDRRDFFLIFKEAVNNLAKYSKSPTASLAFKVDKGILSLYIEDKGVGFDMVESDNGNGLGNMRKRAEQMGARLKIHSEKGAGTQMQLDIPLH